MSAVSTGMCDVASDWAACSVIPTATPHRSSGKQAGRNGWPGGEVCSGSPLAGPVPRRLVSANFENASRIRAFGSVRVFGHDGTGEDSDLAEGLDAEPLSDESRAPSINYHRIAGGLMKAPRRGLSAPEYDRKERGRVGARSLICVTHPSPFLAASSPIPSVKS